MSKLRRTLAWLRKGTFQGVIDAEIEELTRRMDVAETAVDNLLHERTWMQLQLKGYEAVVAAARDWRRLTSATLPSGHRYLPEVEALIHGIDRLPAQTTHKRS